MALGALIIKEKLGISDRETVEQIRENPYLQYFVGLKSYRNEAPFEASMLVHFRQRLEMDLVNRINSKMCKENGEEVETEKKSSRIAKKKRM
jgi:transposase, IS5 family